MTPKVKIFPNVFPDSSTGHQITFRVKNLVKIGHCEVAERSSGLPHKKLALCGTRPSPHFAQNGPIASKIPWTLSPLDMSTYAKFCLDKLRFARLIPERLIFRPKKSIPGTIWAFSLQKCWLKISFWQKMRSYWAKDTDQKISMTSLTLVIFAAV